MGFELSMKLEAGTANSDFNALHVGILAEKNQNNPMGICQETVNQY